MVEKGVDIVRITDHEIGNGVYFNDPDGNRLEFFLQTELDPKNAQERFTEMGAPSRDIDFQEL